MLDPADAVKKKTEGLPSAVNASIMLAKLPQQVSALKNLVDYRISVISYAPTSYGQVHYITDFMTERSQMREFISPLLSGGNKISTPSNLSGISFIQCSLSLRGPRINNFRSLFVFAKIA